MIKDDNIFPHDCWASCLIWFGIWCGTVAQIAQAKTHFTVHYFPVSDDVAANSVSDMCHDKRCVSGGGVMQDWWWRIGE